jgi:hypothetical protein
MITHFNFINACATIYQIIQIIKVEKNMFIIALDSIAIYKLTY